MNSNLPIVLALGHRFATLKIERSTLAGVAEVLDGNTLPAGEGEEALRTASIVMLGTGGRLDATTIMTMSACRGIVRYGVGVDNIAVGQASAQGIPVINVPEYCVEEVSDHTVALILAANRRLIPGHEAAGQSKWGPGLMAGTARLATQTVGILGFGRIGQEVGRKVRPMVARVTVHDPFVLDDDVLERGCIPADFESMLETSDWVTINCPLTPETHHLFDAQAFAKMKPTAWLINTARGEIVQEQDLVEALESGRIGGAALDVLTDEPPTLDSPLLRMPNVIVTPHVAWYSRHAVDDLQRLAAEQALRVLTGKPLQWVVNREARITPSAGKQAGTRPAS
jgi:D-3-phosphoglycerate dehydrogenase